MVYFVWLRRACVEFKPIKVAIRDLDVRAAEKKGVVSGRKE
jgi:hypothetical protein